MSANNLEEITIELGEHNASVKIGEPTTFIVAGDYDSDSTKVIELENRTNINFEGLPIEIPNSPAYLVKFPTRELIPGRRTEDQVEGELLFYVNGSIAAGAIGLAEGRWLQEGYLIPGYLGVEDLMKVSFGIPIYNKNNALTISKNNLEKTSQTISSLSELSGVRLTDINFPGRWDDNVLASNIRFSSGNKEYVLNKSSLNETECYQLKDILQKTITENREGDRDTRYRLAEITLPRLMSYTTQYKH